MKTAPAKPLRARPPGCPDNGPTLPAGRSSYPARGVRQ